MTADPSGLVGGEPAFAPLVPGFVAALGDAPPARHSSPEPGPLPSYRRPAPPIATGVGRRPTLAAVPTGIGVRGLDEMPGAGVLTPLVLDPTVTDVLVNRGEVWVDRGRGLIRVDASVGFPADVRRLAQRLASACGRRLDEACPFVDARLADGTRLHAVLPPVATDGPYLSLRTFRHRRSRWPIWWRAAPRASSAPTFSSRSSWRSCLTWSVAAQVPARPPC